MPAERIEFLSAALVVTQDVERLAAFYKDVLGLPLVKEQHDGDAAHYGCQLGDLHFAIHSADDFPEDPRVGVGGVRLAFTLFDLDRFHKRLAQEGILPLYAPKELGWCRMTAVKDPDGNVVELTQLNDDWFKQLAERKRKGFDLVLRWKAAQALKKDRMPEPTPLRQPRRRRSPPA